MTSTAPFTRLSSSLMPNETAICWPTIELLLSPLDHALPGGGLHDPGCRLLGRGMPMRRRGARAWDRSLSRHNHDRPHARAAGGAEAPLAIHAGDLLSGDAR